MGRLGKLTRRAVEPERQGTGMSAGRDGGAGSEWSSASESNSRGQWKGDGRGLAGGGGMGKGWQGADRRAAMACSEAWQWGREAAVARMHEMTSHS